MIPIAARSGLFLSVVMLGSLAPALCFAQETGAAFPPPGWHASHVRVESGRRFHGAPRTEARGAVYRGLTINRAPLAPSDDIYDDGETRYNDIAGFNPAPAITSGTQFPYGLDGIGGYGLDLGFAEGQDAAVYQRAR